MPFLEILPSFYYNIAFFTGKLRWVSGSLSGVPDSFAGFLGSFPELRIVCQRFWEAFRNPGLPAEVSGKKAVLYRRHFRN
jgi:hypothetical protein